MSSGTARTEDIHRDPCMVPEIGTAATTVTFPLPNQWITGGCTTWTGVDWEDPNLRLASNRANPSAMKLSADAWRDHVNWPLGERAARTKRGTMFVAFQPAISKDAQNKISGQIRRWRLTAGSGSTSPRSPDRSTLSCGDGCSTYGAFYRSALNPLLSRINAYVMRWIRNKYKRLRTTKKAKACWQRITGQHPRLFAHWAWPLRLPDN